MSRAWWLAGWALLVLALAGGAAGGVLLLEGQDLFYRLAGVALTGVNAWHVGRIVATMVEARGL